MGQYDSAFYFIQQSTTLAVDSVANPHLILLKGYNSLAAIYGMQGDFVKAGDYFKLAVDHHIQSGVDNPKLTAKLYNNIGTVYERISVYDSAIVYFEKSLLLKKTLYGENAKNLGSTLNNMGILYNERGYYGKAIEILKQALQTIRIDENKQTLISIYHNLGIAYFEIGDWDMAENYFRKELNLNVTISGESHIDYALNYNSLGRLFRKKMNYELALQHYNTALDLLLKHNPENKIHIGLTHNNLGDSYQLLFRYDEAFNHFIKSIDIYEALDYNSPQLALILSNLGKLLQEQNQLDEALEYFTAAYDLRLQIFKSNHPQVGNSLTDIGYNHFKQGQIEIALETYQNAYTNLSEYYFPESQLSFPKLENVYAKQIYLEIIQKHIEALIKLSQELPSNIEKIQILQAAIEGCEIAINLIRDIRNNYLFSQSKYILSESIENIYGYGVSTAYSLFQLTNNLKYKDLAFQFSEYSRASLLWETLHASKATEFGDIPKILLDEEKSLKSDISYYLNEIQKEEKKNSPELDFSKIDELRNEHFILINKFDELMKNIVVNYPNYYEIKHPKRNNDISKIQNTLKEDELLLEYYFDSNEIYIFCISNTEIQIHKEKKPPKFNESINEFTRAIKKVKKQNFYTHGNQLYQYLIEPIEPHLMGKFAILFVPNGELAYLPFESIPIDSHSKGKQEYTNTIYLINKYSISYLSSADIYSENKKSDDLSNSHLIGFAPVDQFAQYHDSDLNVSALPFSKTEVQQIENLYSNNSFSAETLIGEFATESNFKSANIEKYDIVHIATHGILNEEHPDLSALLFYKNDYSDEDGILYASEIYNMQINTNLTVLSSCESGSGKMINGEGILSLARGFMYAGTDNIIYTLWKVGDKSSNLLLTKFYENVLSGMDYSQSLRQAKLSLVSNEATSIPRNWSGYILMRN
ncbi:MAG: CHAT domain-containing protein [Candidatus Marinimicrobia bacterium]|nr:CHAT domain-containing protein [Candidatus Neomarinimicrobiota bacterium]